MIKKKTIFISGATGILGRALCDSFSSEGSNLIITDINKKDLISLKGKITKKYKNKVSYYQSNLSNIKSREKLLNSIRNDYKNIDFIINNAAFTGLQKKKKDWLGNIHEQTVKTWNEAIEINLSSIFHITKELSQILRKGSNSGIINLGSIYSEKGPDLNLYKKTSMGSPAAYFSSKGGLLQLTRWMAANLAPTRVNMVSPGGIYNNQPNAFVKKYLSKILIKRMCRPEDITNLILFLCSEKANYITGQNIKIDGGYSCT